MRRIALTFCFFTCLFLGKVVGQQHGTVEGMRSILQNSDSLFAVDPALCFQFLDSLEQLPSVQERGDLALEIKFKRVSHQYDVGDLEGIQKSAISIESLAKKVGDERNLSRVQLLYGLVYQRLQKPDSAALFYQEGYAMAMKLGDTLMAAKSLNNLGNIYGNIDRLDRSTAIYKRAMALRLAVGDTLGGIKCLNNLGINLLLEEKLDSAILYAQRSIQYADDFDYTSSKVIAYQILMEAYLKKENLREARRAGDSAVVYAQRVPSLHASTLKLYANILIADKEYNKAKEMLLNALEIADSLFLPRESEQIYYSLANVFTLNGEHVLANEALKRHAQIKFDRITDEKVESLDNLAAEFDKQESQETIRQLVSENDQQKRELRNINIYKKFFVGFAILLLLAGFYSFTRYRIQQRANAQLELMVNSRTQELEEQYREKSLLFKELHHRVKNNMQLILSFLRLQKHFMMDKSVPEVVDETISRIQSMAAVHEKLFLDKEWQNGGGTKVFFENLIRDLLEGLLPDKSKLELMMEIENVELNDLQWVPTSLILNEWLSNGIKYAYGEGDKQVFKLGLKRVENGIELSYEDFGKGMPKTQSPGLGLTIVEGLVQQLDGKLYQENKEKGLLLKVVFA